jgi:hypothetical protein
MKPLRSVLWCSLATSLAAGCLTPAGYDRAPDAGATATGGAPAQGGQGGHVGQGGSPGTGGTLVATGGSPGSGGATGRGGTGGGSGGAIVSTGTGGKSSSSTGGAPPPPPPGTILYSDDFSADAAGATAIGWLFDTIDSDPTKGTFSVVSDNGNLALQGAATGSDFIMDIGGDASWTDYTFQVDIKMISGSSFEFGVFGRFALGSDKGNYYEAYMDNSGAVQLRVRLDGSTTTLGTKSKSTTGNAQLNTVYTFKLDMHGGVITVSINGVPRVSMAMDTTLSGGGIGLIVNNGTAEFDNVYVTE